MSVMQGEHKPCCYATSASRSGRLDGAGAEAGAVGDVAWLSAHERQQPGHAVGAPPCKVRRLALQS